MNYGRGYYIITYYILHNIFTSSVIYGNCWNEHDKHSMDNIIHGQTCNISNNVSQGSTESICLTLEDNVFDRNGFANEDVVVSLKHLSNVLEASKLFTKTSDVLIVTSKQHEETIDNYFDFCTRETVPYKLWVLPDHFDGKYITKNIEMWMNDEVQKIIMFCSVECASLFLGSLNDFPGLDSQPVFFIFSRKVLFFSTNLPKLIIAVEESDRKYLTKSQKSR